MAMRGPTMRLPVRPSGRGLSRRGLVKSAVAVAAVGPLLPRLAAAQERQVNVYNWDTYIGETTLDDFTEATGIAVRYDLYADNAELFARLREGNPGYDVIVPSSDYNARMSEAGMLMPLDHAKIPNFVHIMPRFIDVAHDPGRRFSMPYFWGNVGIGYRKSAVEPAPDSWGVVFDQGEPYAGRISWLSNPTDVIQAALKYQGISAHTRDPADLQKAEDLLIRSKPFIRVIAGDNGQDLLLSGEVDLAMEFNGDIVQVMAEDDDLSYVSPREGTVLFEDAMAIPTGAPHPDEAHEFINYILTPEVHAAIAEFVGYALPNEAALALMPEEYRNNPAIFPPPEVLDRSEVGTYLGEEVYQRYDEIMTRVRAA